MIKIKLELQENFTKILYAFGASIFIIGLRLTLSWSYNSRFAGIILLTISIVLLLYTFYADRKHIEVHRIIDFKKATLGLSLILIDIFYNLYAKDPFGSFDYGMLFTGLIIILLNIGASNLLRFDKEINAFTTYFLFTIMLVYGFLFTGLPFLLNSPSNPLFDCFTKIVADVSAFLLGRIRDTTIVGNVINFDGFRIGIGYACSGVESLTVFFSALISYITATRKYKIKTIIFFIAFGSILLFLVNILRVMVITMVGYKYGLELMWFVHLNLGWIMFIFTMFLFWFIVFKTET